MGYKNIKSIIVDGVRYNVNIANNSTQYDVQAANKLIFLLKSSNVIRPKTSGGEYGAFRKSQSVILKSGIKEIDVNVGGKGSSYNNGNGASILGRTEIYITSENVLKGVVYSAMLPVGSMRYVSPDSSEFFKYSVLGTAGYGDRRFSYDVPISLDWQSVPKTLRDIADKDKSLDVVRRSNGNFEIVPKFTVTYGLGVISNEVFSQVARNYNYIDKYTPDPFRLRHEVRSNYFTNLIDVNVRVPISGGFRLDFINGNPYNPRLGNYVDFTHGEPGLSYGYTFESMLGVTADNSPLYASYVNGTYDGSYSGLIKYGVSGDINSSWYIQNYSFQDVVNADVQEYNTSLDVKKTSLWKRLTKSEGNVTKIEAGNEEITISSKSVNIYSIPLAEFGQLFGSTLGQQLAGKNQVTGVLAGSVLGTVIYNVGEQITVAKALTQNPGATVNVIGQDNTVAATYTKSSEVWSNFNNELRDFTAGATIGAVSSYLSMELGSALGLKGFGAEMFTTAATPLLSRLVTSIAAKIPVFSFLKPQLSPQWSASGAVQGAFVSYFATKLAAMVYSPKTEAGMVLSSLGASAGGMLVGAGLAGKAVGSVISKFVGWGVKKLGETLANILLPGVGVFIGFIIGAIIGDLFGKKKQRVPSAYADVIIGMNGVSVLGLSDVSGGGNLELAQYMSSISKQTLEGMISTLSGGQKQKQPWQQNLGFSFGHTNDQLWVKMGSDTNVVVTGATDGVVNYFHTSVATSSSMINVNSADEAVDKAVLWALGSLNIRGGNMFLKRAVKRTKAESVAVLSGDLQIAEDYGFYLQNRSVIDAAIAEPYTSMKLATNDYLNWVRNNATYFNEYKADIANEDAAGKDLAKIRAWGEKKAQSLGLNIATLGYGVAAEVDTNFYNANKSFMTRAMAKDSVALSAADLATYNANKVQVDRIISRLALTQFAASWIITLQRAAELEINRASVTDFIGGGAGFADSLRLMSASGDDARFYDDIKFALQADNTTLRVSYADGVDDLGAKAFSVFDLANFWSDVGYNRSGTTKAITGGVEVNAGKSASSNQYYNFSTWTSNTRLIDYYSDANGYYTGGNDIYITGSGADYLEGWGGDDWLDGGAGNDTIYGYIGDDVLLGRDGNDNLYGQDGDDYVSGGNGADTIYGYYGDDTLVGGAGVDAVYGEAGNDTFIIDDDGVYDFYKLAA